jgi:hypothetical protein
MAHGKKVIPGADKDFDILFKRVNQYTAVKISGTPPDWDHIPSAASTGLSTAYADWYTFYAPTLKDPTSAETVL